MTSEAFNDPFKINPVYGDIVENPSEAIKAILLLCLGLLTSQVAENGSRT